MTLELKRLKQFIDRLATPSSKYVTCNRFGYKFSMPRTHYTSTHWGGSGYRKEPETTKYLLDNLQPDDLFVDIGAHIGYYTLLAASRGCKVVSIEPIPAIFRILKHNVYSNSLKNSVDLLNCAVSDIRGVANFYVSKHVEESSLKPVRATREVLKVNVDKLDNIVDCADWVKMDVEGFEYRVLLGMSRLLLDCAPSLIVEFNPKASVSNLENVMRLLEDWECFGLDYNMIFNWS